MPDPSPGADREGVPTTGAPRWVKVFAAIVLAVAVLVAVALFAGGGHGPGRHTSFGVETEIRLAQSGGTHPALQP